MKKIRKGNDMLIKIEILTNNEPIPIKDRAFKLILFDIWGHNKEFPYRIEGQNIMSTRFFGVDQKTGMYGVTIWENFGEHGQAVFDIKNAFMLVDYTPENVGTDPYGLTTETISITANLAVGVQGPSNYERACEFGFKGTEEEYLKSLHGEPFTYNDFTPDQIAELQRPATDAANVAIEAAQKANEAVSNIPGTKVIKQTKKVTI